MKRSEIKNGAKFSLLTIIDDNCNLIDEYIRVKCICECGNETHVRPCNLLSGSTKSCGCLKVKTNSEMSTTHGKSKTRLYNILRKMKYRCSNSNFEKFHLYGGKGIKVCKEWIDDFSFFHLWAIENGYSDDLTIDRIDPNDDYKPSNCRWLSRCENSKRAQAIFITVGDKTNSLTGWSKILGVGVHSVTDKYKKNGEDYIKLAISKFLETGDNSAIYERKGYSNRYQE